MSFVSPRARASHVRRRPPHAREPLRPGRRVNDAAEMMAAIVAGELVEALERSGFVVMQRAPIGGGAALGRGFER